MHVLPGGAMICIAMLSFALDCICLLAFCIVLIITIIICITIVVIITTTSCITTVVAIIAITIVVVVASGYSSSLSIRSSALKSGSPCLLVCFPSAWRATVLGNLQAVLIALRRRSLYGAWAAECGCRRKVPQHTVAESAICWKPSGCRWMRVAASSRLPTSVT